MAVAMRNTRRKSRLREYGAMLFWTLTIFLAFRTSVAEAYRTPSPSIESTLLVGDYLFASKFEYGGRIPLTEFRLPGLRDPKPGDVVVFRYPPNPTQNLRSPLVWSW
jgi:signal peptidase I